MIKTYSTLSFSIYKREIFKICKSILRAKIFQMIYFRVFCPVFTTLLYKRGRFFFNISFIPQSSCEGWMEGRKERRKEGGERGREGGKKEERKERQHLIYVMCTLAFISLIIAITFL